MAIPLQLTVAVWYKHLSKKKKINQKPEPFRLEGAGGAQPPAQSQTSAPLRPGGFHQLSLKTESKDKDASLEN